MPQYHIGREILDTAHKIKVSINSQFEKKDLTSFQARIMGFLDVCDHHGKDVYQKDIEAEFNIRRSSVTSVLNNMEKKGYVIRQSVESDARLKKIVLTEKSKKISKRHYKSIVEFEKKLVENMSEKELETIKQLLDKVSQNITE